MSVIEIFSERLREFGIKICYILFFILTIQPSCCVLTEQKPVGHPASSEPLAVVIERDPWLEVYGADTPRAVLYGDGTLIYLRWSDKRKKPFYVRKTLDSNSLKKFREAVSLTDDFSNLKSVYKLADISDMIDVGICLSDGKRLKAVSVYGMVWVQAEYPKKSDVSGADRGPDKLPEEFGRIYDIMTGVSYPDAEEWIPAYIEVMIWPFEYAKKESLPWPDGWPSLSDSLTRRWRDKSSYSLYISGGKLCDLEEFLSKKQEGQAVLIDGKKWSVSYRFVFPGEHLWADAFAKAEAEDRNTPDK